MTGNVNIHFCIYVLPEYKNKGIGKLAMDYMEQLHPADKWILAQARYHSPPCER